MLINKGFRTNLKPFIDWVSYTFELENCSYVDFLKFVNHLNPDIVNGNSFKLDGVLFLDRTKYIKLEFTSSWFKDRECSNNMKQVEKFIDWLIDNTKVHNWVKRGTLSRVDVGCNDYKNDLMVNKWKIVSKRKCEVTRWYKDKTFITGIGLGKRGKSYVYYRCYSKKEDSAKARTKAVERFGTYCFTRHEYECGRNFIKKKNLDFKSDWESIFFYLFDIKRIDFDYINIKPKRTFANIYKQRTTNEHLIKQVIGIIRNNLMNERDEIIEKIKSL